MSVNKQLLDALMGYENIVRIVLNGLRRDYEERGLMIRKEFHDELSAALGVACEAVYAAKSIAAAEQAQQAEPVAPGLYAILYRDNWDGDGDVYHLLAEYNDGKWYAEESGKELLQYEGDAILRVWPLTDDAAQPPAVAVPDAVALLREMEWENNRLDDYCPVCANSRHSGHASDCKLAAVLASSLKGGA